MRTKRSINNAMEKINAKEDAINRKIECLVNKLDELKTERLLLLEEWSHLPDDAK